MRVAVIYASKHKSTAEIATAIAGELSSDHHEVELHDASELRELPDAGAYVLGSGVYGGRWLKPMRELVESSAASLASEPVWLFSVGPIGDEEQQSTAEFDASALTEATGARDHRVFAGRLDPAELSLGERLMVRAVKAPTGDYRDWEAIRSWAHQVGTALALAEDGSGRSQRKVSAR
jgi:menaquinone-dependent protoporphyrinogen oxidase